MSVDVVEDPFAVIDDARIAKVLHRLHAEADRQMPALLLHYLPKLPKLLSGRPMHFDEAQMRGFYRDKYIALERAQAAFCYLTARAIGARTIVEFGTSLGVSTLWLAAAVRANGGGRIIGTELVEEKAIRARRYFDEAGVADLVDLRTGDALQTLRELPAGVDLFLNDGFPVLALEVLKLVAPRMRTGAVVIADNVGTFKGNFRNYLRFLRDPHNGFATTTLPFKSGTEYSVRVI